MFLLRFALLRFGLRRLGPFAVVLTAYDLWRRLPKRHRDRLVAQSLQQGAKAAGSLWTLVAQRLNR